MLALPDFWVILALNTVRKVTVDSTIMYCKTRIDKDLRPETRDPELPSDIDSVTQTLSGLKGDTRNTLARKPASNLKQPVRNVQLVHVRQQAAQAGAGGNVPCNENDLSRVYATPTREPERLDVPCAQDSRDNSDAPRLCEAHAHGTSPTLPPKSRETGRAGGAHHGWWW